MVPVRINATGTNRLELSTIWWCMRNKKCLRHMEYRYGSDHDSSRSFRMCSQVADAIRMEKGIDLDRKV